MPRRKPDLIDIVIGRNIRLARESVARSQQGLAQPLGITYQQLQKYERGVTPVFAAQLCLIAHELGVPVSALLPPLKAGNKAGRG